MPPPSPASVPGVPESAPGVPESVPGQFPVFWHPISGSQLSVVQGSPSSQTSGVPGPDAGATLGETMHLPYSPGDDAVAEGANQRMKRAPSRAMSGDESPQSKLM